MSRLGNEHTESWCARVRVVLATLVNVLRRRRRQWVKRKSIVDGRKPYTTHLPSTSPLCYPYAQFPLFCIWFYAWGKSDFETRLVKTSDSLLGRRAPNWRGWSKEKTWGSEVELEAVSPNTLFLLRSPRLFWGCICFAIIRTWSAIAQCVSE